ncbi:MAG TPA: hypothetical protein VIV59_03030, partial [Anaeromyxobacteraceae bacterium]
RAGEYLDSIDEARVEVFTLSGPEAEVNPAVYVSMLDLYTAKQVSYAYQGTPPASRRRAEASPLRFTWEYRNPGYYAADGALGAAAVVVVSDDLAGPLPERIEERLRGHRLARVFAADDGVFRSRPLVSVYRASSPRPGQAAADR